MSDDKLDWEEVIKEVKVLGLIRDYPQFGPIYSLAWEKLLEAAEEAQEELNEINKKKAEVIAAAKAKAEADAKAAQEAADKAAPKSDAAPPKESVAGADRPSAAYRR